MTMREILFRGKRHKDYGEGWVYGVPFFDYAGDCIMKDDASEKVIYPDTIGQFTGLTDKNGKKIFEGDIVRAVLPKSNAIPEFVWPDMVVGFSEGAFSAMRGRYCTPLYSFAPAVELEVIGNIHDNPKLIGGERHG